jgi:hypothetical protein
MQSSLLALNKLTTDHASGAVKLQTCIREVRSSNLV